MGSTAAQTPSTSRAPAPLVATAAATAADTGRAAVAVVRGIQRQAVALLVHDQVEELRSELGEHGNLLRIVVIGDNRTFRTATGPCHDCDGSATTELLARLPSAAYWPFWPVLGRTRPLGVHSGGSYPGSG